MSVYSRFRSAIQGARRPARCGFAVSALLLAVLAVPLPAAAEPMTASEILNGLNRDALGSTISASKLLGRDAEKSVELPRSTYDELIVGSGIPGRVRVPGAGGAPTLGGEAAPVPESAATLR